MNNRVFRLFVCILFSAAEYYSICKCYSGKAYGIIVAEN